MIVRLVDYGNIENLHRAAGDKFRIALPRPEASQPRLPLLGKPPKC